MTNRQVKICRNIQKYKHLERIISKSNVTDYMELQEAFEPGMLCFSDYDMTDKTVVTLNDYLLEEYENRIRSTFREWLTLALSICAIIISLIALLFS